MVKHVNIFKQSPFTNGQFSFKIMETRLDRIIMNVHAL